MLFVNNGSEDIFISFGETATLANSLVVKAVGGSLQINDPQMFLGVVNAISVSGGQDLRVLDGK